MNPILKVKVLKIADAIFKSAFILYTRSSLASRGLSFYRELLKHRMSPLQTKEIIQELCFSDINILETNGFRVKLKFSINRKIRKYLLKKGFLKMQHSE